MAVKKRRKSAFVPRLLVRTAIVGVIPACAAGCGGSGGPTAPFGYADAEAKDGSGDAQPEAGFLGVAAVAYRGYEGGAPPDSGGAGATDAAPDVRFPVWVLAATAYEVGAPKKI